MKKLWLSMKRDFYGGAAESARRQYNFWLKKLRETQIQLGEITNPMDTIHNSIRQFFEGMGMDIKDAEVVVSGPVQNVDKDSVN